MNYIYTERALTVFSRGKAHTVHSEDKKWNRAIELLRLEDEDALVNLMNPAEALINFTSETGDLDITDGVMRYKGTELPGNMHLVQVALNHIAEGLPADPLVNYIERLMKNPSNRAINELLGFLEYGQLPITSDGYFLAYKRVNSDYTDCHSGTINNSVGQIVTMPRNAVDDKAENTCSHGLHFCSKEYLNSFRGARLMALKIDPADVVSIPVDYNNTKGRCCRYEVVAELDYDPTRDNKWDSNLNDDYTDEEDIADMITSIKSFKVGDHVFFAENGINGTITFDEGIESEGSGRFELTPDDHEDSIWVDSADLDLVEKKPKTGFQIGDVIKVRNGPSSHTFRPDTIGQIIRVHQNFINTQYDVSDNYGLTQALVADEMELVFRAA